MSKLAKCPPRAWPKTRRKDQLQRLVEEAANEFGVQPKDVMGRSRVDPLPLVRKHVWIRLTADYGWELHEIAKAFMRHHTTVFQAIRGRQKQPRFGGRR